MLVNSFAVFFSRSQSVIIDNVGKTTIAVVGGSDTLWLFNVTSPHGRP